MPNTAVSRSNRWLIAFFVACALGGCATITGQSQTQPVFFSSPPPGASVFVDGDSVGMTLCTVALERSKDHVVVFWKAGFRPDTFRVRRSIDSQWYWKDLLIGLLVDIPTGRAYRLDPDVLRDTLKVPSSAGDVMDPAGRPSANSGLRCNR